jgi:uncharacterized membrane protein (UPF0182 family)
MIKIVLIILILLLAADVAFRDGALMEVLLRQDIYIPFFAKILLLLMAIVATVMLFHSIIWEYLVRPKPDIIKTPLQMQREQEAIESEELAEKERLEMEKVKIVLEEKVVEEVKAREIEEKPKDPPPADITKFEDTTHARRKSKLG